MEKKKGTAPSEAGWERLEMEVQIKRLQKRLDDLEHMNHWYNRIMAVALSANLLLQLLCLAFRLYRL